jgi:stringent starvation protein B
MTSSRPYLLRALYEWLNDNQVTPYILINATLPDVNVPQEYVSEGKIVLNIAPDAVQDFYVSNTHLDFHATFSGRPRYISVTLEAVLAIYAKENGVGWAFGEEPGGDTPPDNTKYAKKASAAKKPQLKVVKKGE